MGQEDLRPGIARYVWHPDYGTARLLWCTVLGVVVTVVVPSPHPWRMRALIGWDIGVFVLLAIDLWRILGADARTTARRADAEDLGRFLVWVLVIGVSAVSLFSAIYVLKQALRFPEAARHVWSAMALVGVVLAWALTHTAYAMRYAHLHYGTMHIGGFEFPGDEPPTEVDFLYVAFTVGMTFATSDVCMTSRKVRRTVLVHSVVSFLYNVTIPALAIQLAFMWLSG